MSSVDSEEDRGWATRSFRHAVRWAFFAGIAVWMPVVVAAYYVGPEQGRAGALVLSVNVVLAIAVGRPGLEPLLRFARSVDANHDATVRATVRFDAQQSLVRRAAEEQRRVHDTAINTLAAVVRGGSAVADVDAVRLRCRADALVLEQLISDSDSRTMRVSSPDVALAAGLSR